MTENELTRIDEGPLHSWIDDHGKSLVELAASLIQFDTQAFDLVHHEGVRNQEGECQAFIRDWLRRTGLAVHAAKPNPDEFREHR